LSLKGLSTQPFATADSFIEAYRPERAGCVLTDLRMPGMTGLELQAELAARHIEVPLVVLTAHGDVPTARAALKNGAFEFLEKPVDDAQLVEVLGNALRVDRERRAAATARTTTDRRIERLTKREREILELIAAGHQNREIAAQLGISARTVEVHRARIMEKLECRSLAELMRANRALS
jgi:RNA polymerase sigma factor (sigma-70 family)